MTAAVWFQASGVPGFLLGRHHADAAAQLLSAVDDAGQISVLGDR